MLGPFYVSQVPANPMVLQVTDYRSQPLNLTPYNAVVVRLTNSRGEAIDTSGGSVLIDAPLSGVVQYIWPSTSLFTVAGDYKFQLTLESDTALDFTVTGTFEVKKPLEAP